jgi:hypothetical protein
MKLKDWFTEERKAWLEQMARDDEQIKQAYLNLAQKRAQAIRYLGEKHLLHPSNRVQRKAA